MYYHFATLLLFRPFIKLRLKNSDFLPRDICIGAANAIQGLARSYSDMYTLQRTPSFVPYFVLTSSIMHLAIAASGTPSQSERQTGATGGVPTQESPAGRPPADSGSPHLDPNVNRSINQGIADRGLPHLEPDVTRSINQGIADLTEMAPCHHFAEQALNILRYLAKKWNIKVDMDVPESVKREKEKARQTGGEWTRISELTRMKDHNYGIRPATNSLNFFAPNMNENDFVTTWGNSVAVPVAPVPTSPSEARSGDLMENPLFWPFPMQGRPILPTGDALAEAGFEPL